MELVLKGDGDGPKPPPLPRGEGQEPKNQEFIYKCPHDGAVRDTPGPCPKCGMALGEQHKVLKPKVPEAGKTERKVYVCDMHPEEVFDKPGTCTKGNCAGMKLEERTLPAGTRLFYTCPDHPEVVSDKPGTCPKDGKNLRYKIESQGSRTSDRWVCPLHPGKTANGKAKCPSCGGEMKHLQLEEVLSVPAAAVIDTGIRKVVFLDRGEGVFDAIEVTLGPQAGEFYQVLKGLNAGDRVVSAGAFLLDAEARLNPAAGVVYFGASGQETKK